MIFRPGQFHVRTAQVHFARNDVEPLEGGAFDLVKQIAVAEQYAVSAVTFSLFQPQTAGGVGLRIEVEQQHALAEHREARRQIYGGRGLTDPALLIGDRDDFGWHCGGLNEKRGWVSSVERLSDQRLSLDFRERRLHHSCMKLILIPHGVTLTEAIEDHVVAKIEKLDHFDKRAIDARVTLEHDHTRAPERAFS